MASIFLDFDRSLTASPNAVRGALKAALHELGFEITTDQVTLVEATRGSRFAGGLLGAGKLPVAATATVTAEGDQCHLAVRLADHSPVGRSWGQNTSYQTIFGEVQAGIDRALRGLDAGAAAKFAPAEFTSKTATIGVLETTNRVQNSLAGSATTKVNQLLSGGPATRVPQQWKKLDTVVFTSDEGAARMHLDELQAHLAVAMLITSQPGSMPPALTAQVTAFATRVETALNQAGEARYLEIPVSDAEEPVVAFLHQQARLRELLPVRTLHRCRTCRFEKITNPDYERLQKRNSRLRALGGSVGATFGKSGVSPFILVGTLFRFAKLDPDYVCPRCQGIDAEAAVVTFCPGCGALRSEAALRICEKCKLDMRTRLTPDEVWLPYPEPVAALPMAPPVLQLSAAALQPPGAAPQLPGASRQLPGLPQQPPGVAQQVPGPSMPMPGAAMPVPRGGSASLLMPLPPPPPPAPPTGGPAPAAAPAPRQLPAPSTSPPSPPPFAQLPGTGGPRLGPRGGKMCDGCGGEFATLYRALVEVGGARRQTFVCGQPPRCNPRSVVQPVAV